MLIFYLNMIESEEERSKFEKIYTTYHGLMISEAIKILKDKQLAEDAVHDACIHLINKIDEIRIDNQAQLVQLVKKIVRNSAIDYIRKIGNERPASDNTIEFYDEDLDKDTETVALDILAVNRLIDAITTLPEKYKAPLELMLQSYKASEIAEILGLNLSTVKMRIHRGREMLKNIYEEDNNE